MRILKSILMKPITLLLLLFLLNCFTVYKKDETVLEKETLKTKDVKEERDVYVLTQTLTPKGLYLFLDAYRVEEKSKVDFIREKYLENKDYKFDDQYIKECKNNGCLIVLAIAIPITILIAPTIPLQMRSEPQERIREEIKKGKVEKIGIISTSNISFELLDRNPSKKFLFKNDKLSIPMQILELDSFTVKSLPYKLINEDNKNILLKGEFDFSELANKDKEIMSIIQGNNELKESAKCNTQYPEMLKQDLPSKKQFIYRKYCGEESTPYWQNWNYEECIDRVGKCYKITRRAE